jgi:hypothetical protein
MERDVVLHPQEAIVYCDACGSTMTTEQQFCPNCGKAAGAVPLMPPAQSRMAGHIRLLGILWLAVSAFRLLPALIFLGMGPFWIGFIPHEVRPMIIGFMGMLGIFFLVGAALGFLAGWGLLERKPWSRTLALLLGVLSLLDIPIGTALGIYTLWALLPSKTEEEFRRLQKVA